MSDENQDPNRPHAPGPVPHTTLTQGPPDPYGPPPPSVTPEQVAEVPFGGGPRNVTTHALAWAGPLALSMIAGPLVFNQFPSSFDCESEAGFECFGAGMLLTAAIVVTYALTAVLGTVATALGLRAPGPDRLRRVSRRLGVVALVDVALALFFLT